MSQKLGNFFLLAGILAVIIFIAAPSRGLDYAYFCFGGASLIFLGLIILRRGRKSRASSRFRTLRWLLGKKGDDEQQEEEER